MSYEISNDSQKILAESLVASSKNTKFLSAMEPNENIFYNDNKEHHTHRTRLKQKSPDELTEEFSRAERKLLEDKGNKLKKMQFGMSTAGEALSLAEDLKDCGDTMLAGKLYRQVRNAVSKSDYFQDIRVFDGTPKLSEPPALERKITAEDAQRYYDSEAGKAALYEIGANNIETANGTTHARVNNTNCTLEMSEDGILRFSYLQENNATHSWEYVLKNKPVVPEAPKAPEKPEEPAPATDTPKPELKKTKEIEYDLKKYQNGSTEFANAKTHNLEDPNAKRLDKEKAKKALESIGISTDDYEYLNNSFKKKGANEFISINDKGQVIKTSTDGVSKVHSALFEISAPKTDDEPAKEDDKEKDKDDKDK